MIGGGAYGARLARHFQLEESQTLLAHTASGHPLAVTRLRSDSNEPRVTTPLEVEQAFIVVLQMRDLLDHALSLRSGPVTVDPLPAGTTIMVDLALEPYARLGGPFDSLNFYIPRVALDEVAAEQGARSIEDLSVCPGRALRDDVVKHLGASLLPLWKTRPKRASFSSIMCRWRSSRILQRCMAVRARRRASCVAGSRPGRSAARRKSCRLSCPARVRSPPSRASADFRRVTLPALSGRRRASHPSVAPEGQGGRGETIAARFERHARADSDCLRLCRAEPFQPDVYALCRNEPRCMAACARRRPGVSVGSAR